MPLRRIIYSVGRSGVQPARSVMCQSKLERERHVLRWQIFVLIQDAKNRFVHDALRIPPIQSGQLSLSRIRVG